jgi:hypothetical protein
MKTPQDSPKRLPRVKDTQQGKKPSAKQQVRIKKPAAAPQSRLGGCLTALGVFTAFVTAGGVIVGGIWLAILLMIDPNTVVWLNQYLPNWTRIPVTVTSPPQTLATIEDEIRKNGLIPGEPLSLNSEILLPVLASSPNCQIDCEQIVELRLYQPTGPTSGQTFYQLANQLPIKPPEEYFVLSSLAGTNAENANESRSLPLTQLTRLDEKAPEQGFWFNLSGQRVTGETPMTYGQVIHYNPDQTHLSVMLQWTNPNNQNPYWQEVTSGSTSELVINQTVGLEPQFKVYQILPRQFVPDPIYLEEISLVQPAIDTKAYRNALMLARNGLWSPAWQGLQSQKKKNWSAAAQAQLDFIQLHALVTQSQAKQAWATPSQQILANLIDGRWADAVLVFQAAEAGAPVQEIATLLKTDSGGLWTRIETALKVNRDDTKVQAWGALMLAAKEGRAKAIAWLQQQLLPPTATLASTKAAPPISNEIIELLDHLDGAFPQGLLPSNHASKIVGTAQLVQNINPIDWLQPENQNFALEAGQNFFQSPIANPQSPIANPQYPIPNPQSPIPLQKEPQQVWYQVQVTAFNDGQRWQQTPFSYLPLPKVTQVKQLWNYLGLDTDPQIQITVWSADGLQESTTATVKAVSYQGGVLQLLAAGETLLTTTAADGTADRSNLLAYTNAALRWLDSGSITLIDLNTAHPKWVSAILPTLWRELVKSGQLKAGAIPSPAIMLRDLGQWSVRLVELTGNNEPEVALTLYEDLSGALQKPDDKQPLTDSQRYKARTLIFSNTGELLYNEFSKDASASLTAIADLGDGGPAALVLNGKSNYNLKRWSAERKRFE